jgi:hypothetical protein
MAKQETVPARKRGPAATGKGVQIGVRLQPADLARLDAWIAAQPDPKPSRPDALRRALAAFLGEPSS